MKVAKKVRAKSRRQEEREQMFTLKEYTEAELQTAVAGCFYNARHEAAFHFDKYGNAVPDSAYQQLTEEAQAAYVFHFANPNINQPAEAQPEPEPEPWAETKKRKRNLKPN